MVIPPHNLEIESAVLSVLLFTPWADSSQVSVEDFYSPTNCIVAEAILKLKEDNKEVDLVSVYSIVKEDGITKKVSTDTLKQKNLHRELESSKKYQIGTKLGVSIDLDYKGTEEQPYNFPADLNNLTDEEIKLIEN